MSKNILYIPDPQVRSGDNFTFLSHIGYYAVDKKPHIIVCAGDFGDMPSLSSHDKAGAKNMEGKRYKADIKAVHEAMEALMTPIHEEQARQRRNKEKIWKPRLVMLGGNHENRINRAINNDPKLEGLISLDDLKYEDWGWEVIPFLQPIVIEGIAFCHYFCSGVMGRPITSARQLLQKQHMSCIAGHQQGRDIAYGHRADGKEMTALIAGSCYEHDEEYLNHQTNNHFRGIYMLFDVADGQFDELPITLRYLRKRYEEKEAQKRQEQESNSAGSESHPA